MELFLFIYNFITEMHYQIKSFDLHILSGKISKIIKINQLVSPEMRLSY